MRISAVTRFRYFPALVFLAVAACRDAVPPTTPAAGPQPALTVAPDGTLRDGGIDPRDTYFAFNVTTTRTVEGGGSAGEMGIASVDSDEYATDESAYLEAGFGSDGVLRFNVYSEGAADPRFPDPPPVVRTVGNTVYVFDAYGNAETYAFNDFLEGTGLPGGSLAVGSPNGSLYNPLGSAGGGGGYDPIYMTGLDPRRTRVNRLREDVFQITTTMPAGGEADVRAATVTAPDMQVTRTFRRRMAPTSDTGAAAATGQQSAARLAAHWVLESVEQTATQPVRGRMRVVSTRMTYQYVSAHIHRGRDQQRETLITGDSSVARGRTAVAPPARRTRQTHGSSDVTAASTDGIKLCERGQANYTRTVNAGGGGVVYQHGFCSDADTWSAMRQRVPETHNVGFEQTYSLNPDAPVDTQVDDLVARLTQAGVGGNVVVAHSQGGLVARRLGQRRPELVSGVVTIGTPHEGALIASRPPAVIADALHDLIGDPCFGKLCMLVAEVAEAVASGFLTHGVGELVPAAGDDQPNSELIKRVNGRSAPQYESFRRASIAMNITPRWALFRMIGDAQSSRSRLLTSEPLKGRNYVRDAQRLYDAARVLRYMALALRWRATDYGYGWNCGQSGYTYYWEPCYNQDYAYNWWRASYWYHVSDILAYISGAVLRTLDFLDITWDNFTTGRVGGTDGFVQLPSQHYPVYVPGAFQVKRFQINGFEAHSGETASQGVLDALRFALDEAGLRRY